MHQAIASLLLLFACPAILFAQDVTLAWNANPEPAVTSYTVVRGEKSGAYVETRPVGNVTQAVFSGLDRTKAHYFAIQACIAAVCGPFSAEVSTRIVAGPPPPPPPPPPQPVPASPDKTSVPPAPQIIDTAGAIWTLQGNVMLKGGQDTGGRGSELYWLSATIYALGTDTTWWKWNGTGWESIGPTRPGSTAPPPPQPCVTSLTVPAGVIPAAGVSGVIAVQTQAGCAWSIGSSVTWITLLPKNGTGPLNVTYTALANTTLLQRTAMISVTGNPQTHTLTQAAAPQPIPPTTNVCITAPLKITPFRGDREIRWPSRSDGDSQLRYSTNFPEVIVMLTFGDPSTLRITDNRGCTATVTR